MSKFSNEEAKTLNAIAQARNVAALVTLKPVTGDGVTPEHYWASCVSHQIIQDTSGEVLTTQGAIVRVVGAEADPRWTQVLKHLRMYGHHFVSLDFLTPVRVNVASPNAPQQWVDCLDFQVMNGKQVAETVESRNVLQVIELAGSRRGISSWEREVAEHIAAQLNTRVKRMEEGVLRIACTYGGTRGGPEWNDVLDVLEKLGYEFSRVDEGFKVHRLNIAEPGTEENWRDCFDLRLLSLTGSDDAPEVKEAKPKKTAGDDSWVPDEQDPLNKPVDALVKETKEVVEDLDLRLVTLRAIEFVEGDHLTIGYVRRVKAWLDQWTVENNYDPVLIVGTDTDPAVRAWRKYFEPQLKQVVGEANVPLDWQSDFRVKFCTHTLRLNEQARPGFVNTLGQSFKLKGE